MARTVDPTARGIRRDAFIDVGQRLIETKGYEQMSIQDVLDALEASRGAFYHYFAGKAELLEAVVERMVDTVLVALGPIVEDPDRSAIDKLQTVFVTIGRTKTAREDLVLALLEVWISDDNAIVREKFRRMAGERLGPVLTRIIQQGTLEGTFRAGSPEGTASIMVSLMMALNELATRLYLARKADTITFEAVESLFGAYSVGLARILGLADHSLILADPEIIRRWFG